MSEQTAAPTQDLAVDLSGFVRGLGHEDTCRLIGCLAVALESSPDQSIHSAVLQFRQWHATRPSSLNTDH